MTSCKGIIYFFNSILARKRELQKLENQVTWYQVSIGVRSVIQLIQRPKNLVFFSLIHNNLLLLNIIYICLTSLRIIIIFNFFLKKTQIYLGFRWPQNNFQLTRKGSLKIKFCHQRLLCFLLITINRNCSGAGINQHRTTHRRVLPMHSNSLWASADNSNTHSPSLHCGDLCTNDGRPRGQLRRRQ